MCYRRVARERGARNGQRAAPIVDRAPLDDQGDERSVSMEERARKQYREQI